MHYLKILSIVWAFICIAGYFFNIYKKKSCFVIWECGCIGWIFNGYMLNDYGLIMMNIVYFILNINGYIKWRKDEQNLY